MPDAHAAADSSELAHIHLQSTRLAPVHVGFDIHQLMPRRMPGQRQALSPARFAEMSTPDAGWALAICRRRRRTRTCSSGTGPAPRCQAATSTASTSRCSRTTCHRWAGAPRWAAMPITWCGRCRLASCLSDPVCATGQRPAESFPTTPAHCIWSKAVHLVQSNKEWFRKQVVHLLPPPCYSCSKHRHMLEQHAISQRRHCTTPSCRLRLQRSSPWTWAPPLRRWWSAAAPAASCGTRPTWRPMAGASQGCGLS